MKYIKTYELFGGLKKFFTRKPKPLPKTYDTTDDIFNDINLSHEEKLNKIKDLCRKYKIYIMLGAGDSIDFRNKCINSSYVRMNNLELEELPIKFGKVGSFDVSNNKLSSFNNFPTNCKTLNISNNRFESLLGCPDNLETLRAENNKIKSLEGLPLNCKFIDLKNNELSDLSIANKIGYNNTYFNVRENNITEMYPISSRSVFISDNPIMIILSNAYTALDYPDINWVDSFNSYNIIYNDGIGKTKIFKENLEYFYTNELKRTATRGFISRLIEFGYEVTTMSEYFKQNVEDQI